MQWDIRSPRQHSRDSGTVRNSTLLLVVGWLCHSTHIPEISVYCLGVIHYSTTGPPPTPPPTTAGSPTNVSLKGLLRWSSKHCWLLFVQSSHYLFVLHKFSCNISQRHRQLVSQRIILQLAPHLPLFHPRQARFLAWRRALLPMQRQAQFPMDRRAQHPVQRPTQLQIPEPLVLPLSPPSPRRQYLNQHQRRPPNLLLFPLIPDLLLWVPLVAPWNRRRQNQLLHPQRPSLPMRRRTERRPWNIWYMSPHFLLPSWFRLMNEKSGRPLCCR